MEPKKEKRKIPTPWNSEERYMSSPWNCERVLGGQYSDSTLLPSGTERTASGDERSVPIPPGLYPLSLRSGSEASKGKE
jgi:hypothetical protein